MHNVPSSVLQFVNFCFLPFSGWTGIQKWKKNWFCYIDKWIHKNEMSANISKCLCQNLFKGFAAYIRAVYKNYKILLTLKRCITSSLSFETHITKLILFYDCRTYENIFHLFENSTNKTKAFNLSVRNSDQKTFNKKIPFRINSE